MVIDNTLQQKKPSKTGFFVLLAIIAFVIFAAYALTKKQLEMGSSVSPTLSQAERQAIADQFKNVAPTEISKKDRTAISKQYPAKSTTSLTAEERAAVASQYKN